MSQRSFVSSLLAAKVPDSSEIEVHLFEFCNLRCHFCGQDHEDKTGIDSVGDKIPRIKEFISNNPSRNHILNIMGGEIFNDNIENQTIDSYFEFAEEIHQHARSVGHQCQFNWVTNLVYKDGARVRSFIERLHEQGIKAKISTSYDFSGRKNKIWSEEIFHQNLTALADHIYTIGFVLTKPAIKFLISSNDPYFDYLYERFPLYFDFYVPENHAAILMPSDQDILDAYSFIAKKYPKVSPVKELLENSQNKMTCYSLNKLTLLPDNREVKCRYLNYKPGDFKSEVDYSTNDNIILNYVQENECLSCDWYSRCGFRCFVQADWSRREKLSRCLFKSFFENNKEALSWS